MHQIKQDYTCKWVLTFDTCKLKEWWPVLTLTATATEAISKVVVRLATSLLRLAATLFFLYSPIDDCDTIYCSLFVVINLHVFVDCFTTANFCTWILRKLVKAGNHKSLLEMKVKTWSSKSFSPQIISNTKYMDNWDTSNQWRGVAKHVFHLWTFNLL